MVWLWCFVLLIIAESCSFFHKHTTANVVRMSAWSSEVCSSDLFFPFENVAEIANSRRRQLLDRPRRDRVDADILAPQIDREILDRGVERRFGDPHHIIRSEERRVGKECDSTCESRW